VYHQRQLWITLAICTPHPTWIVQTIIKIWGFAINTKLEGIYEENVDKIYKFFYIKCLNQRVSEDLTSQTFIKFLDKFNSETEIKDVTKYLYGIMRRTWSDHLRDKYASKLVDIEDIGNFEHHVKVVVDDYESKTLIERASKYISRLPEKQQHVMHMRLIQGLKIGEIARTLGKSKNYVKTTQRRGIRKLEEMLAEPNLMEGNNNEII